MYTLFDTSHIVHEVCPGVVVSRNEISKRFLYLREVKDPFGLLTTENITAYKQQLLCSDINNA